jgi:uncharacterized repeat protein (TIGR02543 family)
MAGRVEVPAGGTVEIVLNPAKDITSQAFLKKFYNQYAADLEITYDISDYPLDLEQATVTFDVDGGSAVDAQTVYVGEKATRPEDPTKDEATFGGWYADAGKTTEFDFDAPIEGDTTVYAKWSTAGNGKSANAGVDVVSKVTAKEEETTTTKSTKKK